MPRTLAELTAVLIDLDEGFPDRHVSIRFQHTDSRVPIHLIQYEGQVFLGDRGATLEHMSNVGVRHDREHIAVICAEHGTTFTDDGWVVHLIVGDHLHSAVGEMEATILALTGHITDEARALKPERQT